MRSIKLLENKLANSQHVSSPLNLPRRTEWILRVISSELNGTPKIYIEEGFSSSSQPPSENEWTTLPNHINGTDYFEITDDLVRVNSSHFAANWARIRYEPMENSTGLVSAIFSYKDYI